MLDRPLFQVVEDLVAGDAALAGNLPGLLQVGLVEVAHSPREDLPRLPEPLEGRERLLEGVRAAPVQEVAVQPVGTEAGERPLARRDRPLQGGILGQDLGDEEDLVASPGDRFADHHLGVAVHLRGIDVVHPEVEAMTQGGNRGGAVALVDVPGALPDHRDLAPSGTEPAIFHDRPPRRVRFPGEPVTAAGGPIPMMNRLTPALDGHLAFQESERSSSIVGRPTDQGDLSKDL